MYHLLIVYMDLILRRHSCGWWYLIKNQFSNALGIIMNK